MSLTIDIIYFAQFREQAGVSSEQLVVPAGSTEVLYRQLAGRHGFQLPQSAVKVAVNDEFVDWDYQLRDGDTVVFIPPVAGG